MNMTIIPYEKVGDLIFGTKRDKVRKLLGPNFRVFSKGFAETNTIDAYDELDIYLYYNQNDELEYIEIGGKYANPIFKGVNLFDGSFEGMIETLKKFDPNPEIDKPGCTFYTLGIELYSGQGDGRIELVCAFSKDYAEMSKNFDVDKFIIVDPFVKTRNLKK